MQLIRETAQHAGCADIIREALDGRAPQLNCDRRWLWP
ncbi:DUF664 domain-containing protein [Streptomyces lateritius]|uniref:DUF664 domain-containing protein n=1 Tax=Streptomyces lateritius TaxID=67313 RepID=A0ABW6YMH8_9ACTN